MAKRTVTRIGDVFCVTIDNTYKVYFQYIIRDTTYMSSQVIRVFSKRYPISYIEDLHEIVQDDVLFYTHALILVGIKEGTWVKVGSVKIPNNCIPAELFFVDLYFDFDGVYDNVPLDQYTWRVWQIGGPFKMIETSDLNSYTMLHLGYIRAASTIVDKIKYGYFRGTANKYNVIKRVPLPDVDSFTRLEGEGFVAFFHFHGEHCVREVIHANGEVVHLDKEHPEKGGFTLRTAVFGDTNWKYQEFISEEEFNEVWLTDKIY